MKDLKKVLDVAVLSRFLLEAGCSVDLTIEEALVRWENLPVGVRAQLAQRHQLAVMLFAERDFPLAQDEWDHLITRLAAEMHVEPKIELIRDRWQYEDSDGQAYLDGAYSLVIEVVENKRLDPYGDPTVQISRAVA